jgi:hypothetical protein
MSSSASPLTRTRPQGIVLAGWVVSGLVALFNLLDGLGKMFGIRAAVDGTVSLGFPEKYLFGIGLTLIICTVLYLVPFTSHLGAVLLTGYLGGATAIQLRVDSMNLWFALALGVASWIGLLLRDARLRAFVRETLLG